MGIFRTNDPTQFDAVDGIIIDESAPAPNIQGVSTNIAIMIAALQRGPAELTEVSSIGEFHEIFGKSASFGGNVALKNKKFGRLRIGRVIASDAVQALKTFQDDNGTPANRLTLKAKQGKGVFGNSIQVKIEEASNGAPTKWNILAVADVAANMDGHYFVLPDRNGTVGFWVDVDNAGGTAPAGALAADRQVEITTIVTGDSAATVMGKLVTAIAADAQFAAVAATGANLTVTSAAYLELADTAAAGDSGFTITETQAGVSAGKKYTFHDSNDYAVLSDETYDNCLMVNLAVEMANSALISAVIVSSAEEPAITDGYVNLASGSDGTIANTDYETAIALGEVEQAGNFMFLDAYNATRNGYLKVHCAATQDKMAILAGAEDDAVTTAITDVALSRDSDGRMIYSYPWVQTSIEGVNTYVSPASFYASLLSQIGPNIDPAYSKNTQFLAGVSGLKRQITRNQYIALKSAGISAFEIDSDIGPLVKSGIVTQIANSSKVTVLRRRMADYLTNSAARFLKNYQGAPNTKDNRTAVKAAILVFVQNNETAGVLPKDSDVKNGLAKLVDTESLNTNNSIAAGFFKILWKQRINSSMRYIVIQAQIGESVVVTEGE